MSEPKGSLYLVNFKKILQGPFVWIAAALIVLFIGSSMIGASQFKKVDTSVGMSLIQQGKAESVNVLQQVQRADVVLITADPTYGKQIQFYWTLERGKAVTDAIAAAYIKKGYNDDVQGTPWYLSILGTLLPFIFIGAIFWFMTAGAQGGGRGVMNFGKSRAKLVSKLRRTIDLTHESLRLGCLLSPASTEFGAAADAVAIAVQTDATKLRQEIFNKIILPMEAEMDGLPYGNPVVLCSDGYWSDLIEAKSIRDTYLNYQAAAELRGAVVEEFVFGGVTWRRYRGTGAVKIPANEARAVPTGVPDTFWQLFAPNDTVESVGAGALGQPYYMGSSELKDSQGVKGWEVSIASHPRVLCGRPKLIRLIVKTV